MTIAVFNRPSADWAKESILSMYRFDFHWLTPFGASFCRLVAMFFRFWTMCASAFTAIWLRNFSAVRHLSKAEDLVYLFNIPTSGYFATRAFSAHFIRHTHLPIFWRYRQYFILFSYVGLIGFFKWLPLDFLYLHHTEQWDVIGK